MQTIEHSVRGLRLLVNLNWDRLLYITTVIFALWLGAFLGTLI